MVCIHTEYLERGLDSNDDQRNVVKHYDEITIIFSQGLMGFKMRGSLSIEF